MALLEITSLSKAFGKHRVIDNLNLSVPEGSAFGFLGPNGAGKTTTMKMVLGLLKPEEGSIKVCGETVRCGETKTNRLIGYLPDVPEFYNYMKPLEYLHLCGQITGMSKTHIAKRGKELLDLVGLTKSNRKIAGFSRGMKQRLGIAQALINEPRLLICDEPTSALDPIGRKEVLNILLEVRGNTTVVFSSHILSDIERICDHIAVLNKGSIVLEGTLESIKASKGRHDYEIEFAHPSDLEKYHKALSSDTFLCKTSTQITSNKLDVKASLDIGSHLVALLNELGIAPLRFEVMEPKLEDLFMNAIREKE